jgi:hypothetical protein
MPLGTGDESAKLICVDQIERFHGDAPSFLSVMRVRFPPQAVNTYGTRLPKAVGTNSPGDPPLAGKTSAWLIRQAYLWR